MLNDMITSITEKEKGCKVYAIKNTRHNQPEGKYSSFSFQPAGCKWDTVNRSTIRSWLRKHSSWNSKRSGSKHIMSEAYINTSKKRPHSESEIPIMLPISPNRLNRKCVPDYGFRLAKYSNYQHFIINFLNQWEQYTTKHMRITQHACH